jgi:hypothetical protein
MLKQLLATAATLLLLGAGSAHAAGTNTLSTRALNALGARWTAEAAYYRLDATAHGYTTNALRALGERYQAQVPTGSSYTAQQLRALNGRWNALAAGYKLARGSGMSQTTTGFAWSDAGIGGAAGFALALALSAALRARNRVSRGSGGRAPLPL